jgi:hypothetical protein
MPGNLPSPGPGPEHCPSNVLACLEMVFSITLASPRGNPPAAARRLAGRAGPGLTMRSALNSSYYGARPGLDRLQQTRQTPEVYGTAAAGIRLRLRAEPAGDLAPGVPGPSALPHPAPFRLACCPEPADP